MISLQINVADGNIANSVEIKTTPKFPLLIIRKTPKIFALTPCYCTCMDNEWLLMLSEKMNLWMILWHFTLLGYSIFFEKSTDTTIFSFEILSKFHYSILKNILILILFPIIRTYTQKDNVEIYLDFLTFKF